MDPRKALRGLFRQVIVGTLLSALTSIPSHTWSAGLFRCVDGNGQSVFTDRTAQMTQCVPLAHENSSSSVASTPAGTPLPIPVASEHSLTTRVVPVELQPVNLDSGVAIPVRRIGQLYVVPVELNGAKIAHLILDTGASHTILSQELVRDLALMPSDFRPGLVVLKTAAGSVDAQVVRIDSMKISTAEVKNSSAAVHTVPDFPPGIDGLLGLSFLHQFEVTLDSSKGELRLKKVQP
jgi:clan AA aspartic protease (TIGR02281 family)